MRIVGGKWRGRKLADLGDGDDAAHLRPSSDRLRESLFNILRHERYGGAPQGMRVLDLFAGTGALSLEALSRGASAAVMVENGAKSGTILRQNVALLQALDAVKILKADACKLPECKFEPFDLIFLDPPYGRSMGEKALQNAHQMGWLARDSVIIWEEELAPTLPYFLKSMDQRKIGRAVLSIARCEEV